MVIQKRDHSVVTQRSFRWFHKAKCLRHQEKRGCQRTEENKAPGWCLWETQPAHCYASLKTKVDKKEATEIRLSSQWKPYLATSHLVRNGQSQRKFQEKCYVLKHTRNLPSLFSKEKSSLTVRFVGEDWSNRNYFLHLFCDPAIHQGMALEM